MERRSIGTGSVWEDRVAYSRGVRVGPHVYIAGTTATAEDGSVVGVDDPKRQTEFILDKIAAALEQLGASLNDVVRTRMFVTDIQQWEAVGLVHGDRFQDIRPTATMVEVSALINPEHMVEIEVDAIIRDSQD